MNNSEVEEYNSISSLDFINQSGNGSGRIDKFQFIKVSDEMLEVHERAFERTFVEKWADVLVDRQCISDIEGHYTDSYSDMINKLVTYEEVPYYSGFVMIGMGFDFQLKCSLEENRVTIITQDSVKSIGLPLLVIDGGSEEGVRLSLADMLLSMPQLTLSLAIKVLELIYEITLLRREILLTPGLIYRYESKSNGKIERRFSNGATK